MTNQPCPLETTPEQFAEIQKYEAVVVRAYELEDGSRTAKIAAWGGAEEMREAAKTEVLSDPPAGVSFVAQVMVMVEDILPQDAWQVHCQTGPTPTT